MKYRVQTGEIERVVDADTVESAFARVLREVDLEKCNKFVCARADGKGLDDPTTMWGITEWYLEAAGYTKIGEHLWRKNHTTAVPSSGTSGENQKKELVAVSSTALRQKSTLRTDYTGRLKLGPGSYKRKKGKTKQGSKSEGPTSTNSMTKVEIQRTPEEWARLLEQARTNRGTSL